MTYPDDCYGTIHSAFVRWLEDMPGLPVNGAGESQIEYENVSFTPEEDTPWIRFEFEPTTPQPGDKTLGGSRITKMRGVVRLSCFGAKGSGSGPVERTADSVMRRFKVGAGPITHKGSISRIASVWREAAVKSSNAYAVPVVVRWWAFTDKL